MIMLNEKDSEIIAIAPVGPVGVRPQSKYYRLIAKAKEVPPPPSSRTTQPA
jgi:hypothetical protein